MSFQGRKTVVYLLNKDTRTYRLVNYFYRNGDMKYANCGGITYENPCDAINKIQITDKIDENNVQLLSDYIYHECHDYTFETLSKETTIHEVPSDYFE